MKQVIKPSLIGLGVIFVIAIGVRFIQPSFFCRALCKTEDNRMPLLSLADLMIVKLTSKQTRTDSGNVLVDKIVGLRKSDSLFYKAFFNKQGELPKAYIYSRPGSCCPCSAGDPTCCSCPPEAGMGDVVEGPGGYIFDNKNSVFRFTSMSPQKPSSFNFNVTRIDDMNVYTIPKGTEKGLFTATIKNRSGAIDLTLTIDVEENGSFHIVNIQ